MVITGENECPRALGGGNNILGSSHFARLYMSEGNDSPFDKFKALSKKFVHVPKREVDRKDKAQRVRKKLKNN
jgi:hypothetical protein